ncbi:MAG: ribosome maturation factor RimP [Negativicutes bacterium]|nr:ribosome maturation factor RimP [Negativicutes bacterium]
MHKEQITQLVEKKVRDIIAGTQLELVDVEYVKERDWYLRVFLDKPGGLDVEDCQWVSERLEVVLDELDPIKESYYLEVSSPGLDRPLKKEQDFLRHIGDKIEINTFAPINGQKLLIGTLVSLADNNIHINVDGNELAIPREKASQVRLHIDF